MYQILHWNLSPLTIITWLQMYLQTISVNEKEDDEENQEQVLSFLVPQYNKERFVKIARVTNKYFVKKTPPARRVTNR